ncbi:MAG: SDR family oxidoreductase [Planctomycetales bacterium]|nr:SDR family oxidoreductase [Planctomycetales bacterium]
MSRPEGTVSYDNRGRVALVSGGSQGIGMAVCQAFLASGAHVASIDINSFCGNPAENFLCLQGDTSSEDDCQRAVLQTVSAFGGLDILVNNAAIQPPDSYVPVHQSTQASWQRMVEINFSGYTWLAKHAIAHMLRQGSGVVVNMSSGQAHRTARGVPCYGPIKAANILQAMQWGVEYARNGIRVVSVSPGAIRTPLVEASLQQQGGEMELANRHPLGRIGNPEEVAAAVLWLCSPAASFITATDLQVDGGLGAFGAFADPYPKQSPD